MFGMSAWHVAILIVVGLFVFGPERLPSLIKDLGKALRQVREQAQTMQEDLKAELGPEVGDLDLSSLHPKTFIQKNLLGEGDQDLLGLKALNKDAQALRDDATRMVRFDKSEDPGPHAVDDAIPQPMAHVDRGVDAGVDMSKEASPAPLRRRTVASPRGHGTTVSPGVPAGADIPTQAAPSAAARPSQYDSDAT